MTGMPWQVKGEKETFPASALTATVLCERHNNALAPIDQFGLRTFNAIIEACDYALGSRHSGRVLHSLISGDGMELWLYKLLAGIHFGGIAAADGGLLRDTCSFPLDELVTSLTTGTLPDQAGFWIASNLGLVERGHISVGPLIDAAKNSNVGVQVRFGPIQFEATLVAPAITTSHLEKLAPMKRPRILDFVGPARDSRVILSWPGLAREVRRLEVKLEPQD
ncbi:hypothetical protein [Parerythrobacter lacustris]|uniref:Uncharacterized protein n=1 Tax=Parerythrobacter lacustris TaxID=2969984 RepID=A0ABT1XPH3_9SPHN|nr:hypothetical protein [Parerythrobacter lacustris]MCR2833487.1 hypothetical protein [Parerythrobacter lacustris]